MLSLIKINILGANVCNESLSTVQKVTHCPRNFTELQLAVKRKRCDAIANIQTCVDPKKFVYHCLVNQQNDGFVEVCAPEWVLAGFCGYYDTVLDRIAPNVNKDCTKSAYPCPGVFNSSETYKYQVCYEVRETEQGNQISDEKGQAHTSTSTNHVRWIIPLIFAVGFFIAFIFACLKIRKMNSETDNRTSSTVSFGFKNDARTLYACGGRSIKEEDIEGVKNVCGIDVDEDNGSISTVSISFKKVSRTSNESNAATEEDTSGKEESFSKRKNTPLTEEEFNKRIDIRHRREINRERQRRIKGNAPLSTPEQSNFKSTCQDITAATEGGVSGIGEEDGFIEKSSGNTPYGENITAATEGDISGIGEEDGFIEKSSGNTPYGEDITAATEGDISGIGEEDGFIEKSSGNTPYGEEQRSGKKRKRKKQNKGNKGKAKQKRDYETN